MRKVLSLIAISLMAGIVFADVHRIPAERNRVVAVNRVWPDSVGRWVPWTPAEITSVAWYDASDADTVLTNGSSVTNWLDKSGNGYDLTQGTGANQPSTSTINGLDAISFDGNDFVNRTGISPALDPLVIVSVYTIDVYVNIGTLFCGEFDNHAIRLRTDSPLQWRDAGLNADGNDFPYLTGNVWQNGTDSNLITGLGDAMLGSWKKGTLLPVTIGQLHIGGTINFLSRCMNGRVGEMVLLPVDDDVTRQKVEGYLAWKWGLQENLPRTHPYRQYPPQKQEPWTPAEISTLAWYDADDADTILTSGSSVTNWQDKSGNGYNLIQLSVGNQPSTGGSINGVDAIDFVTSGGPDWMYVDSQFPNSNADFNWVAALVGERTAPPSLQNILTARDVGAGNNYTLQYRGDFNVDRWQNNSYSDGSDTLTVNGASNCLYSAGAGLVVRDSFTIATNSPGIQVCRDVANRGWDGAIGEIICGTGTLDSDTKDKIEGYLAWKWGIQSKLPSDHPYKNAKPTIGD